MYETSLALPLRCAVWLAVPLCTFPVTPGVFAQCPVAASAYQQVGEALKSGNLSQAEEILRTGLRDCPRDVRALGWLGVVLDGEKRFDEADRAYTQALEIGPRSASLLNNLGNHYLAQGETRRARAAFLQAVALDPHHPNANFQLAQMSLNDKRAQEALQYLSRLPSEGQNAPRAQLLRCQALFLSGQRTAAKLLLRELQEPARNDPQLALSIGEMLASWKDYPEAEQTLEEALAEAPTDFDILYNLGVVAAQAGHLERARAVLSLALGQRPEHVDALSALAQVYAQQGQAELAAALLEKAQRLAPGRPDTLILLAQINERLGYYGEAAAVYDRYLKIRPGDDEARRERGFTLSLAGFNEGLQDLREYARKHPRDAQGLYELAVAEIAREPVKARQHFSDAITVDPNFLPARLARAVLNYQEGKYDQAMADLKFVLDTDPKNCQALDALGETQLRAGQPQEAVRVLQQAAELAPQNAKVLLHYSHALRTVGRGQEADVVLGQFRLLGSGTGNPRPHASVLDLLGLPPTRPQASYLASLQKRIEMDPDNVQLQVRLAKEQLAEGKTDQALETFRQLRARGSKVSILADCAKSLLAYGQYETARDFLSEVLKLDPAQGDARLDLAIAVSHLSGPAGGLAELDEMPLAERQGNYYLLRAQMLDALGKAEDAAESLNRGLSVAPSRPDLYFGASLFLIDHEQYEQALRLLQQGMRAAPDVPQLMLSEAIVYTLMGRDDLGRNALLNIESRWPEWSEPYLIDGITLADHRKFAEAKPLLETAIALGVQDSVAYYNLSVTAMGLIPPDVETAERAIEVALRLNPHDPYVECEAGEVAYARKQYPAALDHLTSALQSWPDMIEAHQTLSACYRALGEKEKSIAELQEVLRIKQQIRTADQAPPSTLRRLLFSVRQSPGYFPLEK